MLFIVFIFLSFRCFFMGLCLKCSFVECVCVCAFVCHHPSLPPICRIVGVIFSARLITPSSLSCDEKIFDEKVVSLNPLESSSLNVSAVSVQSNIMEMLKPRWHPLLRTSKYLQLEWNLETFKMNPANQPYLNAHKLTEEL